MSSISGRLEFKDAEPHLEISTKCSDGSKPISHSGSEDAQESDGDDTGYINQRANEESRDEAISKPIPESLPLKSLEDEGEDQNLATALQEMFSEIQTLETLIPAIKGSREKHGLTSKKLSVTWAEDVYDPPPSIVSHTRGKKQQPKPKTKDNSKKNGKKGQKGSSNSSSSRGSGSKEKKQSSRKHNRDKFDWVTQMPIVAASS